MTALSHFFPTRDLFFRDFFDDFSPAKGQAWAPKLDLVENEDSYVLQADIPGVDEKDIKVTLEDNVLSITGERKHEEESKDKNAHRIERSYGSFIRRIQLHGELDVDHVDAHYNKGVLEIKVPKKEEQRQHKEIPVRF